MSVAVAALPARADADDRPALPLLGGDLLHTSVRQRWWTLSRPLVLVALYVATAALDFVWLLPLVVFLLFIAVVTAAHDVVHGSIGLGPRASDLALFLLGAVLFESGHAYRITHHRHHAVFPRPDDPEGSPAKMSWQRAVLQSPLFLPRLWLWAVSRRTTTLRERAWLALEAAWFAAGAVGTLLVHRSHPDLAAYFVLALVGSWSYPLLTVHLPHRNYGDTPVTQTHTLRGRLVPRLFLELTYHLEHHLYPVVPSHRLRALSQRLEPWLVSQGIVPRRWI